MSDPLRVALFGYGLAGRVFHAPLIAATPGLNLVAVVTANSERVSQAGTDHPGVDVVANEDQIWSHADRYDLVVVATANSAHVPSATKALEHGLHVVVDKPLAGTADIARELIDVAAKQGSQLHVFQNRRWDSDILTVQQLLAEGVLGTVHRFESRFERWRPAPSGGWRERGPVEQLPGLLYDLGAHLVDQALLLLGPVTSVYARARSIREPGAPDDDTQLMLQHESGAVSLLWASAVSALATPRMSILGTRGGYRVDALDGQEEALRSGDDPTSANWGVEPPDRWGMLVSLASDGTDVVTKLPTTPGAWTSYYPAVAASINTGAPPPVDPHDVVADLRVIEAAALSARSGDAVNLNPPAGHYSFVNNTIQRHST